MPASATPLLQVRDLVQEFVVRDYGGVKGGVIEGATDEVGYRAVEKPHYISDLQSTISKNS